MPSSNNPPTEWEVDTLIVGPCSWDIEHLVDIAHFSLNKSKSPSFSRHGTEDVFLVALGFFQLLMWTLVNYNLYTSSKGKPWWSSILVG